MSKSVYSGLTVKTLNTLGVLVGREVEMSQLVSKVRQIQ